MHLPTMLAAPLLAAITAFTVSTQVDVPVQQVYVPLAVFGGPGNMQDDRISLYGDKQDVTPNQIAAAEDLAVNAGIPRERIRTLTQTTDGVRIGILLFDLGTPQQAAATAAAVFPKIHASNVGFGWKVFVSVDCASMNRSIDTQIREQARRIAAAYTPPASGAKIGALSMTSDPRTGAFDPAPLCPANAQPVVHSAGGMPPRVFAPTITHYASANVEVSYRTSASSTGDATSLFPFSTFGFPTPIIGHQNRAFLLRGGRFAATPGASEVVATPDAALVYFQFNDPGRYQSAVQALQKLNVAPADYAASGSDIYVRLRPVTAQAWANLQTIGEPQGSYRFVRDCRSFRHEARIIARERSRDLARAAARVLGVALGPLVVDTDWAGPSTDAVCGSDGSGPLADLISFARMHGYASYGDPTRSDFWESLYAAWTLGRRAPSIVSSAIVERLNPVIVVRSSGEQVTGTATITPDAYFYTNADANDFRTTVVASKSAAPQKVALGNVVMDCESAQERAIANAVRVALFDGPINSFLAEPARLLSIACLPSDVIGHTYSSLPTVYNDSSATGAAQATDTITVYRTLKGGNHA